ncbi:hypothetical protein ATE92_0925 [Ulvibacter sp. MAR_2010_11]|nr:hypothetical protein ATE92_0925 [Ulvibacter sp. MAR_2010_11]
MDLSSELVKVHNKNDFFQLFERIFIECTVEKIFPMLHFEIHGDKLKKGLILTSGEIIEWNNLYEQLVKINNAIGNHLFITLAVCYGAYLMQLIQIYKPSPFWGIIGSFEEIQQSDILIRYNEFYNEFLDSLNLNSALEKLHKANPTLPSNYRFINSEETFQKIYKKYISERFTHDALNQRTLQIITNSEVPIQNRSHKRKFSKDFKKKLMSTRKYYFKKHKSIFFMTKEFPENKTRFKIKLTQANTG